MSRAQQNPELGGARVKALIVIGIVVILVICGWVFLSQGNKGGGQKPHDESVAVADSFANMLASRNAAGAYDMLNKKSKEESDEESWTKWAELSFANVTGQPAFVKELAIHNASQTYGQGTEVVRYIYSFTSKDGSFTLPLILMKEGGVWKIAEIGGFEGTK